GEITRASGAVGLFYGAHPVFFLQTRHSTGRACLQCPWPVRARAHTKHQEFRCAERGEEAANHTRYSPVIFLALSPLAVACLQLDPRSSWLVFSSFIFMLGPDSTSAPLVELVVVLLFLAPSVFDEMSS
uniref:Uncharacterized protein n=1 Tax=Zea mays TaxID=4577 RepID=A0A804N3J4_MAIZE